ncbi:hypothetical protein Acr_01g0008510 [Actinidia rufa]|uniref:Uncharacterized protein n=1 Tax=Actinidia rufa TaxID=165716 RepID=A0A7J0E441_9ERIC|nr:hypothetical protein Acr_01g0008510 [Actinidia rufa]
MALRFRTLGQKKSEAIVDPSAMPDPHIIQDPQLAPSPVLSLTTPNEVIVANFAKDHNTSLALAQAVMLPNDVTDLAAEGSEEIHDLLVMQQVQRLKMPAMRLLPKSRTRLLLLGHKGIRHCKTSPSFKRYPVVQSERVACLFD